ncbi:MAG TPA: hypothetical protein VFR94_21850 [Nitrososphaeraceae archaeon]|nr:hypothetical protein [Nitrososphaeraceae archaeon]
MVAVSSNPLTSLLSFSPADNIRNVAGQEEEANTVSSGMGLSPRPVWDEMIEVTDVTRTNETQMIVNFIGTGQ